MTEPPRPYARHEYIVGLFAPDWRWRRAQQLAGEGDPHAGRYIDDEATLRAVRLLHGSTDPDVVDVATARDVYHSGGVPRRKLVAYLLTDLREAEIGERVGLTEGTVRAFHDLYCSVRGTDPLTRAIRFSAEQADDPLTRAAWYGPIAIEAVAAIETGEGRDALPPSLVERFERQAIMDRLYVTNVGAYLRAVNRIRAIDAGLPPGVMHRPRRCTRRSGAGGDEG